MQIQFKSDEVIMRGLPRNNLIFESLKTEEKEISSTKTGEKR